MTGNEPYYDEKVSYFPPELVSHCPNESVQTYHSYLIELKKNYEYDLPVHNIILVVRREFETDVGNISFELEVDRGNLTVDMKYAGVIPLTSEQVVYFLFLSKIKNLVLCGFLLTTNLLPGSFGQKVPDNCFQSSFRS